MEEELKEAFRAEDKHVEKKNGDAITEEEGLKDSRSGLKLKNKKGLKITSVTIFVFGLIVLGLGIVFLVLKMNAEPKITDAEYLVSKENWHLDDGSSSVVWNFTEIGKGTLTTNNHINDYDFIWAIEGDVLKIETDWLYLLENEYSYELDRENDELILKAGEETIIFKTNF